MAQTRSFRELVKHQVATDPFFADALSREVEHMVLARDVETAKIIRRDYLGFDDSVLAVTKGDRPV